MKQKAITFANVHSASETLRLEHRVGVKEDLLILKGSVKQTYKRDKERLSRSKQKELKQTNRQTNIALTNRKIRIDLVYVRGRNPTQETYEIKKLS